MRRTGGITLLVFLVLAASWSQGFTQSNCTEVYGPGNRAFSVATGSPGELGLLKVLGEAFAKEAGVSLCWIKAGSGESLRLLQNKREAIRSWSTPTMGWFSQRDQPLGPSWAKDLFIF